MSQTLRNGGYGGDTASAWLLVLAAWIVICLRMGISVSYLHMLLVSPAYLDLSYDFSGLFYTQMYSQLPCYFLCISGTCRSDHGRRQSCSWLWSMCSFISAVKCGLNMASHYFHISPFFSGPSSPSCTPHSASPCCGTVRALLNAVK